MQIFDKVYQTGVSGDFALLYISRLYRYVKMFNICKK